MGPESDLFLYSKQSGMGIFGSNLSVAKKVGTVIPKKD